MQSRNLIADASRIIFSLPCGEQKQQNPPSEALANHIGGLNDSVHPYSPRTSKREIIVNKIMKAGFSVGWVSALDTEGHTLWIADAHRDNGKRFVVRSDEKLTAFVELESAIRGGDELA